MMSSRPRRLLLAAALIANLVSETFGIFCYKCESYRDFRCLDPFDYQPHIQVNCDYEPFVRDRKPVFCEKTTELVDGGYVTTRGCSTKQWEDVDIYLDHRNQDLRCFRRASIEQCLCTRDSCNSAPPRTKTTTAGTVLLSSSLALCSLFSARWRVTQ